MATMVGGLDTILSCINSEADAAVNKITAEAKAEADSIISAALTKAAEIKSAAKRKAESEFSEAEERENTALEHHEKQRILSEKQCILNRFIADAVSEIKADDKKYFKLLEALLKKRMNDSKSGAVLLLSKRDLERMPAEFKNVLDSYSGLEVHQSEETDYGFKLSVGDSLIIDNCEIDALVEAEIDTVKERINHILFA